jgi:hypothetical protein
MISNTFFQLDKGKKGAEMAPSGRRTFHDDPLHEYSFVLYYHASSSNTTCVVKVYLCVVC